MGERTARLRLGKQQDSIGRRPRSRSSHRRVRAGRGAPSARSSYPRRGTMPVDPAASGPETEAIAPDRAIALGSGSKVAALAGRGHLPLLVVAGMAGPLDD